MRQIHKMGDEVMPKLMRVAQARAQNVPQAMRVGSRSQASHTYIIEHQSSLRWLWSNSDSRSSANHWWGTTRRHWSQQSPGGLVEWTDRKPIQATPGTGPYSLFRIEKTLAKQVQYKSTTPRATPLAQHLNPRYQGLTVSGFWDRRRTLSETGDRHRPPQELLQASVCW